MKVDKIIKEIEDSEVVIEYMHHVSPDSKFAEFIRTLNYIDNRGNYKLQTTKHIPKKLISWIP